MGKYGGTYDARYSRRELKQRKLRVLSYFLLSALATATVAVVLMALQK